MRVRNTGELNDVTNNFVKIGIVALALAVSGQMAEAGSRKRVDFNAFMGALTAQPEYSSSNQFQIAQEDGDYGDDTGGGNLPISAREAASIAKSTVPGARVLKVKPLSSGDYAVTLKGDGKLTRVIVNGYTGAVN